jgi:hypothetical protein
MRTSLNWLAAAVALTACGGNVVVDGAGGDTTTTSSSSSTSSSASDSCEGCTTTSASATSSSGVSNCISCDTWASSGGPSGSICPGASSAAYQALVTCACAGGACATNCEASFCINEMAGQSCLACLSSSCSSQDTNCKLN